MKICLGSKNPVKLKALEQIINEFLDYKTKITTMDVDSMVSDQPISLEETIKGAVNRSKNAYCAGDFELGAGIESGVFKDPTQEGVYYNTTICALYNGSKLFKGIGPAFTLPKKIGDYLILEKMELDDAVKKTGLTDNKRIGYSQGLIGLLSNGIIDRMRYTKPAVAMAVTAYLNDI